MIRLMFDSDVIADLPRNALAATYSDLIPDQAALTKLKAEFPLGLVLIDRHGDPTGAASVLDVETSLHTPADIPGWLDRKKTQGITGTVYCNRSNLAACDTAAGTRQHYRWIATLDGTMRIPGFPAGKSPAAVQFANEHMLGFHCDASVIWQDQWHPAPVTWPGSGPLLSTLKAAQATLATLVHTVETHQ
jgi:hypothetical protein